MTLREALTRATGQLHASPDLRQNALQDAIYLLLHTLAISRATLLTNPNRIITLDEQAAYQTLIQRRLTNEPIQYITGEQEFYGLTLLVNPAVLIPRPETELLIESVLHELQTTPTPPKILDIGTGSGAIAIALAHHLPDAAVTALDISRAALEVAEANACRHCVSDRIRFLQSDLLGALDAAEAFDVIVSNPPYVPEEERMALHPQVNCYEPALALFAGSNGMNIYRRLIPEAYRSLSGGGLLAMEIGYGQREAVRELLNGWSEVRFIDDLQQIPRVALARKS